MAQYTARAKGTEREICVRGRTIEEAAQHAIDRLVSRSAQAMRVTGNPGLPGLFQGYMSLPRKQGGGMTSRGPNVHVF